MGYLGSPMCSSCFGFVMDFGKIYGAEFPKGTTNASSGKEPRIGSDFRVGCRIPRSDPLSLSLVSLILSGRLSHYFRDPKDHINTRISHPGSRVQYQKSCLVGSLCFCGRLGSYTCCKNTDKRQETGPRPLGVQRPHRHEDPRFWLKGPRRGGSRNHHVYVAVWAPSHSSASPM